MSGSKMQQESEEHGAREAEVAPRKELSPAAKRALAEAEERRRLAAEKQPLPRELNGRVWQEPTRYGSW